MKKIGEIKGVPVVEGNKNEITKNQFHYEETGGGIQLSKRGNDNKLTNITSGTSSSDSGTWYIAKKPISYSCDDEALFLLMILPFSSAIYERSAGYTGGHIVIDGGLSNPTNMDIKIFGICIKECSVVFDKLYTYDNINSWGELVKTIVDEGLSDLVDSIISNFEISTKEEILNKGLSI